MTTAADSGAADGSDGAVTGGDAAPPPPDYVGFGDGHDGAFVDGGNQNNFNLHYLLTSVAKAGSDRIGLGKFDQAELEVLEPDDVLLVWQTTVGLTELPASTEEPLSAAAFEVGQYELARIAAIDQLGVTLVQPLRNTYRPPGAQAVLLPQYTTVTLTNADLSADTFDPLTGLGGLIGFLATGEVAMDDASLLAANQSGGRAPLESFGSDNTGCQSEREPLPDGQAKGGGFVVMPSGVTVSGRGNFTTGGGGGVCQYSGGGGGGHGAAGGIGGVSADGDRPVGGMGGAAVEYDLRRRLLLGGAGGNGHGSADAEGGRGGAGAGVVFVRAQSLTGEGDLFASGTNAGNTNPVRAGGGGGAGGAIYVRVETTADCATVDIDGGGGRDGDAVHAPGGGGSYGVVLIESTGGTCGDNISARPGQAGNDGNAGECRGAGPFCCGDGQIDFPEECDLGADNGTGMGCSTQCENE